MATKRSKKPANDAPDTDPVHTPPPDPPPQPKAPAKPKAPVPFMLNPPTYKPPYGVLLSVASSDM